jgi:hypothetical protein
MAKIKSYSIKGDRILLNLEISKKEYILLNHEHNDLLILPSSIKVLNQVLTTGKLGNSNRIMIPKKFLERKGLKTLDKKVNSQIFTINDDAFLIAKIRNSKDRKTRIKWHTTLIEED